MGMKSGSDAKLLRAPLSTLPLRRPIVFSPQDTATAAMRAMQREGWGCVVVTEDGTPGGRLQGIFTERDVLFRIVDRGRNPATLPLGEVMTTDPETLEVDSPIAYALHMMSIGGLEHLPVLDAEQRPVFVASVRDVVEFLVSVFPREVLNLPAKEAERPPRAREGA
jgi:CBS domain-containing protein